MLAPIEFSRVESVLTSPRGWLDLAIVALCLAIAWLIDRRIVQRIRARSPGPASGGRGRLRAGMARGLFSFLAIVLLVIARAGYPRFNGDPIFIDIAIPLLIALAAIRITVYVMRRIFADRAWLKTSERAIAFTMWGVVVLYFVGALPEIRRELDSIVIPFGDSSVSLFTIGTGVFAVVVTLVVTLWLSSMLEQRVMAATSMDTSIRAVIAKVLRAVLLVVGVLVALKSIGFDLTLLTVFSGALGIGIGLGLQKLAANYISGFTILLDGSIRLGDMVTVDNRHGVITRVTARYVVVRSLDGIEAIVPNETLVTTTVLNHTSTNPEVRMGVAVQIAYDSDVDLAIRLMEEAARAEPRVVIESSPPTAYLLGFADSGINLELGVWLRDPEKGLLALRSAINRRIFASFRANGIVIPYPRRDVQLLGPAPSHLPPAAPPG